MKFLNKNLNKILIASAGAAIVAIAVFLVWFNYKDIEVFINNEDDKEEVIAKTKSPITGQDCERASVRPIAVMLSSDAETRPLSGIGQADLVFEMPVAPNGITRFMAVYQCEIPKEIGSVRSSREDFIPLAASLNAIYAHWGGEKEALAKLNSHVLDNIDAMIFDGTIFYRKNNRPRPHNGFTNMDLLTSKAKDFKYKLDNTFLGYLHTDKVETKSISNLANSINPNYPYPFNVLWQYDQASDTYKRSRSGTSEIDANNGQQVRANVVITMKTTSSVINQDYINVTVVGEGSAQIYQNGIVISGKWKKDPNVLGSKLYFYDAQGKEIEFTPGKIWVEIVTN